MNLELTDKELINFLLTSEFEDNFSPEQHKFLLHKFRYFYRLLYAKYESSKFEVETLQQDLDNLKIVMDTSMRRKDNMISDLNEEVKSLRDRKLSIKERFSGKVYQPKKEANKNEH
jgi:hypothetical protein